MRYLLLAWLAIATAACRDATDPRDPALSAASTRAHIDLREERASLIAAGNAVSAAMNSRTVDTHVAVLRRKLGHDPGEPGYILTVAKAGYRLRE
jgi:hypothetical protein